MLMIDWHPSIVNLFYFLVVMQRIRPVCSRLLPTPPTPQPPRRTYIFANKILPAAVSMIYDKCVRRLLCFVFLKVQVLAVSTVRLRHVTISVLLRLAWQ